MNWAERAVEALVGYAVDWNATGTWLGAIGTMLAIVVSTIAAIAVPLRMRSLDDKAGVRHALELGRAAATQLISGWRTIEQIVIAKELNPPDAEHSRRDDRNGPFAL